MLDRIGAPGSLDQQIRLVSLHDRCDVGTNGQVVSARAVMQATADGQDRWLLVYDRPAPELTGLRNCHLGRLVVDAEHGVTVAELLFDRPVDRGETQLIEYSISTDEPAESHFREFRRPIREYLLEVHFAAARRPSKCWQYTRENTSESPARRELKMDADNGVHAVTLDFGPGAFGILWN